MFFDSGVRRKLCALSLTARAQHGELPLPMPTILRRPTHMILVTGMTPNGLNVQDSSLHDDFLSPQRSSMRNSNGSESNQCGVHRPSNRRFNGSSGSGINPLSKSGLGGTEEENRNLMAETRFRSGPRTPRYSDCDCLKGTVIGEYLTSDMVHLKCLVDSTSTGFFKLSIENYYAMKTFRSEQLRGKHCRMFVKFE